MEFTLEAAWSQICESSSMPKQERTIFLDGLLARLEKEAIARPVAYVFFLIGYVCYIHPTKTEQIQKRILASFTKAIEIDPNFGYPKLQLAHYYYDIGNYQLALHYFEAAATAKWSTYYVLVIQEMLLCTRIALDGIRTTLRQFEIFVATCQSADECDVFPDQLFKCYLRVFPTSVEIDSMEYIIDVLCKLVILFCPSRNWKTASFGLV